MSFKMFVFLVLGLIGFSACAISDNSDFDKGFSLYNQHDWINSQPPLRAAAEAGHSEAQYYLAEALRLSNRYTTEEAQKWYEAAAEQGDLYAMIRLGSTDDLCGSLRKDCKKNKEYWTAQAREQAAAQAKAGDKDAMEVMYYLSSDRDWLRKASDLSNSNASYLMAKLLLSDTREAETGKTTLIPEAEKYLRKSAEGGNPKAMSLLSSRLDKAGQFGKAKEWLEKCLLTSHHDCVLGLEMIHKQLIERYKNFDYKPDKSIAYGLLLFRREAIGKAKTSSLFDTFEDELTAEQKAEGEKFFKEWKKNHPPLSYHVPKLGF